MKKKYVLRNGRVCVVKDYGLTISAFYGQKSKTGMTREEYKRWLKDGKCIVV